MTNESGALRKLVNESLRIYYEGIERRARVLDWAVGRWCAEVMHRPLQNAHRRSLDDAWRQVIRHCGGDDVALCGPRHDELLAIREARHD